MSTPLTATPPRLMTFEEFLDYGEPGVRYELVDGVPVEMPQPNKRHQWIVLSLAVRLMRWISERRLPYAVTQLGLQISEYLARIPDLVVCRREDAAVKEEEEAGVVRLGVPVVLVVEVASENWRDDYGKKREEYARRGVPVYVVVDWRRRCVVVCREPEEATGRYQQEVTYREGEEVVLEALGGCVLAVSEVLGGAFGEDLL
ncbi:MAG: Uma2 family endonuclease, partial [Chloracidobacterium sp.]|nr:Uma2 family endonuclease [Chloracidobacterium sp.]